MNKEDTINILGDPVRELVCPECNYEIDVAGRDMLSPVECPQCGANLTVPARLGDFILIEMLGVGGMATVYKAYDESLGRFVAVKIMRSSYGEDPKFVERFLREARAAARLNHPNVVQIYSCAQKNGQPYIVMEYVDGGKFDEIIANESPIEESRVLDVGRDVADGLRAASDIGLVHGDIKPANIVFDRNGLAKVADFGLAHFATEQEDANEVWGTPYYIAPERARKEAQDHRADIYCLGATLFHAITGEPPFEGDTAVDVVMARLEKPAPDVRDIRPDVSPSVAKLIGRMLELKKIKRYPNYNSLLSDMQKTAAELEDKTSKTGKSKKQGQAKKRQKRRKKEGQSGRKKGLLWVLAVLVLVAVGGGVWFFQRSAESQEERPVVEDAQVAEKIEFQPFDERDGQELAAILEDITLNTLLAARDDLDGFSKKVSDNKTAFLWVELFAAMADMMGRRSEDADSKLNEILEKVPQDSPVPQKLPRRIASYLQGDSEEVGMPEGADWPGWYSDITLFFQGLYNLKEGETDRALKYLNDYSARNPPETPEWPYSLQTVADNLGSKIQGWQTIDDRVAALLEEEDYKGATELLKRVQSKLFVPFKEEKLAIVEKEKKEFEEQLRKKKEAERRERERKEKERREEERRKHQAAVDDDMEALESWDEKAGPMMKENNFSDPIKRIRRICREMDTEEGQEACQKRRTKLEYLKNLKDFIVSSINDMNYSGGSDVVKGTAIASTRNNITVELPGGKGTTEYSWSRVGPEFVVPITRFYIVRRKVEDTQKAELMMGLAEYSKLHELGMEDRFRQAAEKFKTGITQQ